MGFGVVGFLMTFVVLSSSAFVFLMYQQQQQQGGTTDINSRTIEAQVLQSPRIVDMLSSNPLLSDSSSSFQSHDHGLYYTYDGFTKGEGGGGTPIFVTDYRDYVALKETPLGKLIIKRAEDLSATIPILGPPFQKADAATQDKVH